MRERVPMVSLLDYLVIIGQSGAESEAEWTVSRVSNFLGFV